MLHLCVHRHVYLSIEVEASMGMCAHRDREGTGIFLASGSVKAKLMFRKSLALDPGKCRLAWWLCYSGPRVFRDF